MDSDVNQYRPDWITSIITKDSAQLIDFIKEAFNGYDDVRVQNEDGTIDHAEIRIGDSVVMMFDAREEWPVFYNNSFQNHVT